MEKSIADIRIEYMLRKLDESDVQADPVMQFAQWLQQAIEAGALEPTAMALATSSPDGRPSVRIVLLKKFDTRGFTFFTNYQSRKGRQISENPFAALVFFWPELERQVRIEGNVEKVPEAESDEYFLSRPEGSRLGAWTSPQSSVIKDRAFLEEKLLHFQAHFSGSQIPRPEYWGGFILKPSLIEFWQGRQNRLHDRIQYRRTEEGWKIERLAP